MTIRNGARRLCATVAAVIALGLVTTPASAGASVPVPASAGASDPVLTATGGTSGLAPATASGRCSRAEGTERRADFRVGHLNIKHGMPIKKFRADLQRVTSRADMVSLNEVAGRIPFLRKWAANHGWWYYPGKGSGTARSNATLARKCQFDLISRSSVRVPGPRLSGPPPRYINKVRYRHRTTGMNITLFTTHLYARIDGNGHPRNTENTPEAIRHIRLLKKLVTAESRRSQVIVGADMNVDYLADKRVKHKNFPYTVLENRRSAGTPGLRSQYSLHGVNSLATHGNRRIDYLYLWVGKRDQRQLFMNDYYTLGRTHSDHNGVIAKFKIRKQVVGGGFGGGVYGGIFAGGIYG